MAHAVPAWTPTDQQLDRASLLQGCTLFAYNLHEQDGSPHQILSPTLSTSSTTAAYFIKPPGLAITQANIQVCTARRLGMHACICFLAIPEPIPP